MSEPGHLTDAELVKVDTAGNRLARIYAPSWLAAATDLGKAFGFAPRITVTKSMPVGGYRTALQQAEVSPGTPAAWSDHCKGRAVDIDNQRVFRNANEALFESILARYGWNNVQTGGDPFPAEPWHFANQSATPAGAGTLITEVENTMAKLVRRKEAPFEGMAVDPSFKGESDLEEGYIVTTDPAVFGQWERIWGEGINSTIQTPRTAYIEIQDAARPLRAAWLRGQPVSGPVTINGPTAQEIAALIPTPEPIDYAALAQAVNDDAAKRLAS